MSHFVDKETNSEALSHSSEILNAFGLKDSKDRQKKNPDLCGSRVHILPTLPGILVQLGCCDKIP